MFVMYFGFSVILIAIESLTFTPMAKTSSNVLSSALPTQSGNSDRSSSMLRVLRDFFCVGSSVPAMLLTRKSDARFIEVNLKKCSACSVLSCCPLLQKCHVYMCNNGRKYTLMPEFPEDDFVLLTFQIWSRSCSNLHNFIWWMI